MRPSPAVVLLLGALLTGCSAGVAPTPAATSLGAVFHGNEPPGELPERPSFVLTDTEGDRFDFAEQEGEVWIDWIKSSGIDVVGDVDDLRPRRPAEDEKWKDPDRVRAKLELSAALDALSDFGRPSAIRLAVLVDRGGRELPIQPDIVGLKEPNVPMDHVVKVRLRETDGVDEIVIEPKRKS